MPVILLGSLNFGITLFISLACICVSVAIVGWFAIRMVKQKREAAKTARQRNGTSNVVDELKGIAESVHRDLVAHDRSMKAFKQYVERLDKDQDDELDGVRARLTDETREVLRQTTLLATKISEAFAEIHGKTTDLVMLAGISHDDSADTQNRKSFDATLRQMFAMRTRYEVPFSIATVKLDRDMANSSNTFADVQNRLGTVIAATVRETDVVARIGEDSFAVLLPFTQLPSAAMFAERLREKTETHLPCSICIGVACAMDADSPPTLIRRAVEALESAVAASSSMAFLHDGSTCQPASVLELNFESNAESPAELVSIG